MAISTKITPFHRIEAFAYDLYEGYFRSKPVERASAEGANLLRLIGPLSTAHTTGLRNLRLAYPNETEKWRKDVLSAVWAEIGRTAAELPHMSQVKATGDDPRLDVVNAQAFETYKKTGAVFIGGHFTNWETLAQTLMSSGITTHITYRPANNPIIDKRIIDERTKYGIKIHAAKGVEGGVSLLRGLKRKEAVGIMNDQKYNEGVAAPLFGYDCMTADGPTRMALRARVPLVPIGTKRVGNVRFRATVYDPLPLDYDAPLDVEVPASVRRVNQWIESQIREAPEQWFWVHKRWPKEAWVQAGAM